MKLNYFLILYMFLGFSAYGQYDTGVLTSDGGWCWFSDPRAIMRENTVFAAWVKSNGTIEAAKFDKISKDIQTNDLYFMLEKDDHDNPGLLFTQNNKLLAMYTRHSRKDLFINQLSDFRKGFEFSGAQLIHPIEKAQLEQFPRESITYANPIRLANEDNRIYCFGRWTGFKPNMMWSDDEGESWTKAKVFITNYPFDKGNRPYVKYYSDGQSRIHIIFTDGHPRNEPTNSVYYAYYENGAFYQAGGKNITSLASIPFEPKEASVIYRSNDKDGRAWIADVGQDQEKNPVVLYTRSPTEENHEYWYARYIDNKWINHKICDSGKWFPQTIEGKTEREPHYFGGMTIHPDNGNVVYLSRQQNGVFEIERWETDDSGQTWISESITKNSTNDNVRPFVPRGLKSDQKELVLWMENESYIHYTDYKSFIKYGIRQN